MPRIKFVHTADLHIDTPFKGLSQVNDDLANRLKDATMESFRNLVDLCLHEQVDFLLIAGDVFDSDLQSLSAQLKVGAELKKLSDNAIPVYLVCGNHDPLGSWMEAHSLPQKVHRFGAAQVEKVTFGKGGVPLTDIYGVSYDQKFLNQNLAKLFRKVESQTPFSIALLHGTIGDAGPHENYAPFKIEDILSKGFDYWALGHIHKSHIVREAYPAVAYPGNPQGRDFGETGRRGCFLVEMETGQKPVLQFCATDTIRFEYVELNLSNVESLDEMLNKLQVASEQIDYYDEQCSYIFRVRLTGRTVLHHHLQQPGEIEQIAGLLNQGRLSDSPFTWIDRIEVETMPQINQDQIRKSGDFTAQVWKAFEILENDHQALEQVFKTLASGFNSQHAIRELGPLGEDEKQEILQKARWMLLDQLMSEDK